MEKTKETSVFGHVVTFLFMLLCWFVCANYLGFNAVVIIGLIFLLVILYAFGYGVSAFLGLFAGLLLWFIAAFTEIYNMITNPLGNLFVMVVSCVI